jgi:hypothetical protein
LDNKYLTIPEFYTYGKYNNLSQAVFDNDIKYNHNDAGKGTSIERNTRLKIDKNDSFVLTITYSSTNGICFYFNGNLLNKIINPTLSDGIFIPKNILPKKSTDFTLFYDRVLNIDEII